MTKRAAAHLVRILYALALVATSLSVVAIVSHTAVSEFSGDCLIDAVVSRSNICDQECQGASTSCAYNLGQCLNTTPPTCSIPCYSVSEGTKSHCDYVIAAEAISFFVASFIFGISLWKYRQVPQDTTPITPRRPLSIAGTALLMFVLTVVAAALLTSGRRSLCNSLAATGSNGCVGTSIRGAVFVNHFLPPHFQRNTLSALILAWIVVAVWISMCINSLLHFYVLYRDEQKRLPVVREARVNSQTKLEPSASSRVPYEGF